MKVHLVRLSLFGFGQHYRRNRQRQDCTTTSSILLILVTLSPPATSRDGTKLARRDAEIADLVSQGIAVNSQGLR